MKINKIIEQLEALILDPKSGLPKEVFHLISRLTPLVNVDLLIKDKNNRTLLAWRDDQFAGKGWHIPGGIVRYKETLETRISKVAENEIGASLNFNSVPIAMNQVLCKHQTRGHFISFLYECWFDSPFVPTNNTLSPDDPGYLQWHNHCPENMVKVHEMYRSFIDLSVL